MISSDLADEVVVHALFVGFPVAVSLGAWLLVLPAPVRERRLVLALLMLATVATGVWLGLWWPLDEYFEYGTGASEFHVRAEQVAIAVAGAACVVANVGMLVVLGRRNRRARAPLST